MRTLLLLSLSTLLAPTARAQEEDCILEDTYPSAGATGIPSDLPAIWWRVSGDGCEVHSVYLDTAEGYHTFGDPFIQTGRFRLPFNDPIRGTHRVEFTLIRTDGGVGTGAGDASQTFTTEDEPLPDVEVHPIVEGCSSLHATPRRRAMTSLAA